MVGVLEQPQCHADQPRQVRVLFQKYPAGWVALPDRGIPKEFPNRWTIAFDGKSLGELRTTDPGWSGSHTLEYLNARILNVASANPPRVADAKGRFRGWCETPADRPLVVVSEDHVADPARWKPTPVEPELKARLLTAFAKQNGKVESCVGDSWEPRGVDYSERQLEVVSSYADRNGRRLVALLLDVRLDTCDGPTEDPFRVQWYVVGGNGGPTRFLGIDLALVDAGDYDGDGHSEVVFWFSGYNKDGYVLFGDDLGASVDYWWHYH